MAILVFADVISMQCRASQDPQGCSINVPQAMLAFGAAAFAVTCKPKRKMQDSPGDGGDHEQGAGAGGAGGGKKKRRKKSSAVDGGAGSGPGTGKKKRRKKHRAPDGGRIAAMAH